MGEHSHVQNTFILRLDGRFLGYFISSPVKASGLIIKFVTAQTSKKMLDGLILSKSFPLKFLQNSHSFNYMDYPEGVEALGLANHLAGISGQKS